MEKSELNLFSISFMGFLFAVFFYQQLAAGILPLWIKCLLKHIEKCWGAALLVRSQV